MDLPGLLERKVDQKRKTAAGGPLPRRACFMEWFICSSRNSKAIYILQKAAGGIRDSPINIPQ
jgi:hypothetical protein